MNLEGIYIVNQIVVIIIISPQKLTNGSCPCVEKKIASVSHIYLHENVKQKYSFPSSLVWCY